MTGFWITMRNLNICRPFPLRKLASRSIIISIVAVFGYLWLVKTLVTSQNSTPSIHEGAAPVLSGFPRNLNIANRMPVFPGPGANRLQVDVIQPKPYRPPSQEEFIERFKKRMAKPLAAFARNAGHQQNHLHHLESQGKPRKGRHPPNELNLQIDRMWKRPMRCTNCTHFRMPSLSDDVRGICRLSGRDVSNVVDLVVLIFSEPGNYQQRDTLRHTFLQATRFNRANVRYLFLVGAPARGDLNHYKTHLGTEQRKFKDILLANFQESFSMRTYKTMIGLKWVTRFCRHAQHVLKTEDDVWINLPNLLTWLSVQPVRQPFGLAGFCLSDNKPSREPFSRDFITKQMYPLDTYPPFCNSPGYVTTPHVARQVIRASRDIPYFPLEDVYVGFCLQALGLQVQRIPGFSNTKVEPNDKSGQCTMQRNVMLAPGYTPDEIRTIWGLRNGGCWPVSNKNNVNNNREVVRKRPSALS